MESNRRAFWMAIAACGAKARASAALSWEKALGLFSSRIRMPITSGPTMRGAPNQERMAAVSGRTSQRGSSWVSFRMTTSRDFTISSINLSSSNGRRKRSGGLSSATVRSWSRLMPPICNRRPFGSRSWTEAVRNGMRRGNCSSSCRTTSFRTREELAMRAISASVSAIWRRYCSCPYRREF